MKLPVNYKPKYSLSIKYLKMIMSNKEYTTLYKKYIEKKVEYWGKFGGKK